MKKILVAVAAVSLIALPAAGAQAKPSGKAHGKSERAGERDSSERRSGERRGRSKRCRKPTRRGFVVRGSLAGHDADSVTLEVARANRHARRWLRDNGPTFDTSRARVSFEGVEDGNGDGAVDLADVVATDRVRVIGKLSVPKRGCDGDTELAVRKVSVVREVEEEDEVESEE